MPIEVAVATASLGARYTGMTCRLRVATSLEAESGATFEAAIDERKVVALVTGKTSVPLSLGPCARPKNAGTRDAAAANMARCVVCGLG